MANIKININKLVEIQKAQKQNDLEFKVKDLVRKELYGRS